MRYETPATSGEAAKLMAQGNAFVLAGGTDLLVRMKSGITEPDLVVDIKKIPAMQGITKTKTGFRIGADGIVGIGERGAGGLMPGFIRMNLSVFPDGRRARACQRNRPARDPAGRWLERFPISLNETDRKSRHATPSRFAFSEETGDPDWPENTLAPSAHARNDPANANAPNAIVVAIGAPQSSSLRGRAEIIPPGTPC